jgi:hypothetical protein
MMIWKGSERKRQWLNRDTNLAFAGALRKPTKYLSHDNRCFGRDSNPAHPENKCGENFPILCCHMKQRWHLLLQQIFAKRMRNPKERSETMHIMEQTTVASLGPGLLRLQPHEGKVVAMKTYEGVEV